jgi:ATP-dependent Lhr-like helicase
VYPVLRALEEAGRIRRGYFVDGLGAAQFALAGALDRLRAVREPSDATPSPARPTSWQRPTRPTRTVPRCLAAPRRRRPPAAPAGRRCVCRPDRRRGRPVPGARRVDAAGPAPGDDPEVARRALRPWPLVADGRFRELVVTKVDGLPVAESPFRASLLDAGFVPGYRGLTLRASAASTSATRG